MTQSPIIVLGFPRSGTTVLRRMLDAHPNIVCPGETFLLRSAARFLRGETIADDLDYGVVGGLGALGFDREEIHGALRDLIGGFRERHAAAAGKSRWAEKTAVDVFYIDEIEALYQGHAQFVCIVRHGLDVVASCHDLTAAAEKFVQDLHRYVQATPSPDQAYARAWAETTERLTGFVEQHPDDACLMRYEDLLDDPHTVMRALTEFLHEDWHPQIVEDGPRQLGHIGIGDWKTYEKKALDRSSVGRWKSLSSSVLRRVCPIVNPALAKCGYDQVPVDAGAQVSDAGIRRHEMAMRMKAARSAD